MKLQYQYQYNSRYGYTDVTLVNKIILLSHTAAETVVSTVTKTKRDGRVLDSEMKQFGGNENKQHWYFVTAY